MSAPPLGTAEIMRGTALDLADFASESVDLIATSPPYWTCRKYMSEEEGEIGQESTFAEFVDNLIAATHEMVRVLRPGGSIFVNLGDRMAGSGGYNNAGVDPHALVHAPRSYTRTHPNAPWVDGTPAEHRTDVPNQSRCGLPWRYAIRVIHECGLLLRAPIIWHKNAIPQNAKDRVEFRHEDVFHFAKSSPCYSNVDVMRGWESVWRIPTKPMPKPDWWERDWAKPAPFPPELPRRIIAGWCPPEGVVLDPFGGSGTTAMVAKALGRTGVSVDLSERFCRLAAWRTGRPDEIDKIRAAMYTPEPKQLPPSTAWFEDPIEGIAA